MLVWTLFWDATWVSEKSKIDLLLLTNTTANEITRQLRALRGQMKYLRNSVCVFCDVTVYQAQNSVVFLCGVSIYLFIVYFIAHYCNTYRWFSFSAYGSLYLHRLCQWDLDGTSSNINIASLDRKFDLPNPRRILQPQALPTPPPPAICELAACTISTTSSNQWTAATCTTSTRSRN